MARAGRRPGPNETREQIAEAARRLFAAQGYDGATMRAIAAEAGVNPALLHHFYGTKRQLFVAAMNLPFNPADEIPQVLNGPPGEEGARLVRMILRLWAEPDTRAPFLALLRSAVTNEQAVTMMRQFLASAVLATVARARGISRLHASAAAAQMMGVALLRYVLEVPPMSTATEDEIVALVGPAIQYYLDGGQPPAASQR
ncbi:TetR family transcriptional regulator [Prauserella sp. PE36]|uniref:TetR/AcrR family transcriptional regulator n=1 Tax=Prauserella endophytica TaxID=1592324 RepID=A0ABY2S2B4_9PSEU|nr:MULTISPECIES: TetR family transcriptional regulator [Prauserella]PXY25056.1 TetR family transcriptional regulator [Prauserella coralliicola]RBM24437.1 TetR family transcriptional regulator [Prauserella sp. PE36]TKG69135.1 TetR/AcrR family transcriptional regulator [Prauserella endophytica]